MADQMFRYQFPLPLADYRTSRASLQPGFCAEMTGVDARFAGGLRMFPGMKTAHYNEDITPNENWPLNFFKCFSVQWGSDATIFHGYAFRLYNNTPTYPPNKLRFVFYDTVASTWRMLTHYLRGANREIDIATNGKFIHVAEHGYPGDTLWLDPDDASKWGSPPRLFGSIRKPVRTSSGMVTGAYGKLFAVDPNKLEKLTEGGSNYLALRVDGGLGLRLVDTLRGTYSELYTIDSFLHVKTAYPTVTTFPYDDFFTLTAMKTSAYIKETLIRDELLNYDRIEIWRTVAGGGVYFLEGYIDWDDYGPTPTLMTEDCIGNIWGTLGYYGTITGTPNSTVVTTENAFTDKMDDAGTQMSLWFPSADVSFPISNVDSATQVQVTGDATAYTGKYFVLVPTKGTLYRSTTTASAKATMASVSDVGGGKTQVVANESVFTSGMVGWMLQFTQSRKTYMVDTYISPTTVYVTGDATKEIVNDSFDCGLYDVSLISWRALERTASRTGIHDEAENPYRVHASLMDAELIYRSAYDWQVDDAGAPPFGGRLAYSGGTCVKLASGTETIPGTSGTERGLQKGDVCFSNLYQARGENFPLGNKFDPPSFLRDAHSVVAVGNFFFVLGRSGVYRLSRVGATMGGQSIVEGWGPVHRWASTAIDNLLAMVTPTSLVLMNANDGTYQTVGAVERIIQDEWHTDQNYISLAYDARLGALVLFNSAKAEALLVWGTTNTVTRVKDIPAVQVSDGPDFFGTGQRRAYFVYEGTEHLTVLEFDAYRANAYPNMAGLDNTHVMSGVIQDGAEGNTWTDTELGLGMGTLSERYEGFYFYILPPTGEIYRRLITTATSGYILTEAASPTTFASGTRWMIAPVVFEIIGWPLDVVPPPRDLFSRRKILSVAAALDVKNTSYFASNPYNLQLWMEGFKQLSTTAALTTKLATVSNGADGNVGAVPISGHLVCPGIKGLSVGVDWELLGLGVQGSVEETLKDAA